MGRINGIAKEQIQQNCRSQKRRGRTEKA